ncbi:MAG: HPr family phosphocarrier protein [Lachnospiraceae bacterium]|nr:HPr family phosphocarrier protein [Lachnospiraceae bacterium]
MVVTELEVQNELGFHARVACKISKSISAFGSSVHLVKNGKKYDLKSVTGVMMSAAKHGETVTIEIEGDDEESTAEALKQLFADKFGER